MDENTALEKTIRAQKNKYYGKFRAFIADNQDPEKRGRCTLAIPSVLGDTVSDWALPCLPYGGAAGLGQIAVPPVGAQVVAEFLEGDVSAPMWTGTFWRQSDEVPSEFSEADAPDIKMLKTDSGHKLIFDDRASEERILVESREGAKIELDSNGSITLTDAQGAVVLLDASANEIRVEDTNGNRLLFSSAGIEASDIAGNVIKTEASGVTVESAKIVLQGSVVQVGGAGGEPVVKGTTFLSLFNAHTHVCTAPGAPSGPPVPPLTPAVLTTKTVAS